LPKLILEWVLTIADAIVRYQLSKRQPELIQMHKSAYFLPRVVFNHIKLYDDQGEVVATFESVADFAFEAVIEMKLADYDFKMRGRANAAVPIESAAKLNRD
jgi:hypothetical protein